MRKGNSYMIRCNVFVCLIVSHYLKVDVKKFKYIFISFQDNFYRQNYDEILSFKTKYLDVMIDVNDIILMNLRLEH